MTYSQYGGYVWSRQNKEEAWQRNYSCEDVVFENFQNSGRESIVHIGIVSSTGSIGVAVRKGLLDVMFQKERIANIDYTSNRYEIGSIESNEFLRIIASRSRDTFCAYINNFEEYLCFAAPMNVCLENGVIQVGFMTEHEALKHSVRSHGI